MAKMQNFFSFKYFLLVSSLALNVGFVMRMNRPHERSFESDGKGAVFEMPTPSTDVSDEGQPDETTSSQLLFSSSLAPRSLSDVSGGDEGGRLVNLDHGDPTMYEKYWRQMGDKTTIVIPGWQSLSYFSDVSNVCWFLEPELGRELVRLHSVVGNAVTQDRHIIVGTGSSQLYLAALYALSPHDATEPMSVVSAAPYYSSYPTMTDYQKSGLYNWAGDALKFEKNGPYIELVTSPNNPDGHVRGPVVNRSRGILVHDLAYYWPQYTPITSPADYDIMLFTVSKSTGHAGMRIGWAIVKDKEIAKKMTKYIELNSIGVSKDSQLRAAKVLKVVADTSEQDQRSAPGESFFKYTHDLMEYRWRQLRHAVKTSGMFSLPEFQAASCTYFGHSWNTHPAFAWLRCEGDIEDCQSFLRRHKILTRGGNHFGASSKYVRMSMVDSEENFDLLVNRILSIRP